MNEHKKMSWNKVLFLAWVITFIAVCLFNAIAAFAVTQSSFRVGTSGGEIVSTNTLTSLELNVSTCALNFSNYSDYISCFSMATFNP